MYLLVVEDLRSYATKRHKHTSKIHKILNKNYILMMNSIPNKNSPTLYITLLIAKNVHWFKHIYFLYKMKID